ncbi:MAG: hypothetical protein IPM01_03545 [Burkholderiaceae bacterium]|nr:hypothetical protein [Burkholderiaceae bacterium]
MIAHRDLRHRGAAIGQRDTLADHIDGHALGVGRFTTLDPPCRRRAVPLPASWAFLSRLWKTWRSWVASPSTSGASSASCKLDRALRVTGRVQAQHVLGIRSLICNACSWGRAGARNLGIRRPSVPRAWTCLTMVWVFLTSISASAGGSFVAQLEGYALSPLDRRQGFFISWGQTARHFGPGQGALRSDHFADVVKTMT